MMFSAKFLLFILILSCWTQYPRHVTAISTSSKKGSNNSRNRQFHSVDGSFSTLLTRQTDVPTSEEGDDFVSSLSSSSLEDVTLREGMKKLKSTNSSNNNNLSGGTRRGRRNGITKNKGIGTKLKECCKKLTHYKANNKYKVLLTLVLATSVAYPLVVSYVYPIGIFFIMGNGSQYDLGQIMLLVGILTISAILGFIYFGILIWFYRSKAWIRCIEKNINLQNCTK
ncbi:Uncharacterized protein PCOAH_00033440 [Plasmodium coatneyi]|uniref:Uncharacterized protein n=1 Tax=Plasmodium coatneyi TaxID=208452 RepID=A0A1B1E235_9APIC|nr:Uncharacterized protein PCOAH_00033440 [Plasmodium coatneyi]ANQ09102.1 Uncharacterized protein PCOAH_00033440 [Plasmodium coatneyi]